MEPAGLQAPLASADHQSTRLLRDWVWSQVTSPPRPPGLISSPGGQCGLGLTFSPSGKSLGAGGSHIQPALDTLLTNSTRGTWQAIAQEKPRDLPGTHPAGGVSALFCKLPPAASAQPGTRHPHPLQNTPTRDCHGTEGRTARVRGAKRCSECPSAAVAGHTRSSRLSWGEAGDSTPRGLCGR